MPGKRRISVSLSDEVVDAMQEQVENGNRSALIEEKLREELDI